MLAILARNLRIAITRLLCLLTGRCPLTTVILLRHADIDLPPATTDEPLNAAGRARAEDLARVLGDAGVGVIYTSTFRRTQQTAAPLADHIGVAPQVSTAIPVDLAASILDRDRGRTVVVVGHSNTVPQTIAVLGANWNGTISEADFDNLFWITVPVIAGARVHHLHYGA
ncbi:SixA phosphatase family protein [Nocardia amamiensis]|uniref:SixA phosphatase family protein n=1 Tax=Nocardia amamiensis TaxID=404578 RepID=UPI0033E83CF5